MRIAGIQINSGPDMNRNVQRAVEMTEIAAEKDAKVICFPELFLSRWFLKGEDRSCFSLAINVLGETLSRFQQVSESTKTVLIVPFFEAESGTYYNSAAVYDAGRLLGIYRKLHLPDLPGYREQFYFSPGDRGLPVFKTSQGKIGVQLCWDNLFPEGSRILALQEAEVVFAPTAASLDTHNLWERAISANAFANNLYIFRINRVGREDGVSFYGRSFCVDPWGEMVSELAGSKEAIILADIDNREREAAAETWGFLRNRRPGEYGALSV